MTAKRKKSLLRRIVRRLFKYAALTLLLLIVGGLLYGYFRDTSTSWPEAGEVKGQEAVVLLHGIARSSHSMRKIEHELEEAGFVVINHDYPSRKHSIEALVRDDLKPALERVAGMEPARIHFVTHSLGGILVRQYADRHSEVPIGRVVMLAPPNQGSEVADRFQPCAPYRRFFGPAGQELGTGTEQVPEQLPPPDFEVGVIAGTRTWNPWFSRWLEGEDDGTVSVERTRLEDMADFATVRATHSLIMYADETVELSRRFLETGSFGDAGSDEP